MEKDIKSSVRLPKTDFAMKANLHTLEKEVLLAWKSNNIYQKISEKNKDHKEFILHDGPPYANGNLHIGHALNKILKDIIVKSYITKGYKTPFILGWDCHGLPIEWKIEEKYKAKGLRKEEVDIQKFREQCNDFANYWIDIQKQEFQALGVIADYDNSYITTDFTAEAVIVSSIFKLLKEGSLYQGKKPVLWSCVEQTALAEAEVEYQDKNSDTAFVSCRVSSVPKEIKNQQEWLSSSVIIWTTTPWTLPSNQAIAYGEKIEYGLYEISPLEDSEISEIKKVIVAKELSAGVFEKLKVHSSEIDEIKGLQGFEIHHPLYGLDEGYNIIVPTLAGDFVETTVGTGLVHIAPSHGEDDFYLCKKYKIIPIEFVQDDGSFNKLTPVFAGEHIFKVNQKIIDALRDNSTLLLHEKLTHSYPHSWRSKAPLIYRLTSQWFISMDNNEIRKKAIKSLDNVEFLPKTGKNRLISMLENRPDWCISRQRSWGVPLGIFIHKNTKKPLINEQVFDNITKAFAKEGSNAWFSGDPKRFLTSEYNPSDYIPVMDVVDVWVDSGLSHNYVLQQRGLSFPADIYLEGSDQHRGWFQSSLVMSLLILGVAPYKKVITHGFILDEKDQKMSKSSGNGMTPAQVVKDFGADILRLWVGTSNYAEDINFGKNILTQQVEIYRKIRNTLRYLIANLTYHSEDINYQDLADIDKWLLHNIAIFDEMYERTFSEDFAIHNFFNKLFTFIISDLSAFYFDIKKDILYCDSDKSLSFKSTLTVFNILFDFMLKWLSPFIPFTMEEVYSKRYQKNLGELFLFNFPSIKETWKHEEIFNKWERIKKIRRVVTGCLEQKRATKEIGSSLEASPIIYLSKEDIQLLNSIDFADVCITSDILIKDIAEIKDKSKLYTLAEIEDVFVEFQISSGNKCQRCWKFFSNLKKDELCERCFDVIHND